MAGQQRIAEPCPGNRYVAQSSVTLPGNQAASNTYVVAIAGTGAMSSFDWNDEDGDKNTSPAGHAITTVVSWSLFVAGPNTNASTPTKGEPYISLGTATGVYELLQMKDPTTKNTLVQFLKSASPDVLIVTGHSLGGALSATLGFYLIESNALPSGTTTYVYPTAGASPGNDIFSEQFSTALPQATPGTAFYQVWNTDVWNTHDVVPQAWSTGPADSASRTLNNIGGIYENDPALKDIGQLVASATSWSNNASVTYTPLPGVSFTAAFATSLTMDGVSISLDIPPKHDYGFLLQAYYQHVDAYPAAIFQINDLPAITTPPVKGVTREGAGELLKYYANLFGLAVLVG
ncbi:MAG: hypothetical protein P4M00_11750 [Azospirillaceae bacterium]|nr:hypothetical protein [Azospirillaceae bacterium]